MKASPAVLARTFQPGWLPGFSLRCRLSCRPRSGIQVRPFSASDVVRGQNRIYDPVRIPPTLHDYLRACSASNTLLLGLFTTSGCTPCRVITPMLTSLVQGRSPNASDKYSSLAFTEIELDSPDRSNGNMMDLGVEYGITSLPTLVGFGGRRSERVTERVIDTKMMSDRTRMEAWINEQMAKGDPRPGPSGSDLIAKLFG